MKHLLTIHAADIGATQQHVVTYRERSAARAIMMTEAGAVYLIHMRARDYYKLPGGGIEASETTEAALHRELVEECGVDGVIVSEVGSIEEFRDDIGLHQTSYCFLVHKNADYAAPDFTDSEIDEQAEVQIAMSIEEAVELVEGSTPADDECRYMQKRDSTFLREAQKLLA